MKFNLRFPLFDQTAVGDDAAAAWRIALPAAIFLLPIVPLLSFRVNSWFGATIPLLFLISFGPLAFVDAARRLPQQYAVVLGVLGVSLISAFLSRHVAQSAGVVGAATISLGYSALIYMVVAAAPEPARVRCGYAFLLGYLIALIAVLLLLKRVLTAWAIHGPGGEDLWGYNRGMVTIVLFMPVALALLYNLAPRAARVILPLLLAVSVAWVSWQSLSETSKIIVFVALAIYALTLVSVRWSIWVTSIGLISVFFLWPIMTPLGYAAVLDGRIPLPDFGSAHERLRMWAEASRLTLDAIWFGHGPHALRFNMPMQDIVRYYHPHSGVGQTWLDLGLVGVVATLAALIAIVSAARSKSTTGAAALITSTIAVCAGNAISHGLWQSWWMGTAGMLPAVILIAESVAATKSSASPRQVVASADARQPA